MITSENVKQQYSPATPTSSFPFDITYFEESDIRVIYTVGVVDTELTLNAVSAGFTVSPVNGSPEYGATIDTTESYTAGDSITIYREVPITNESAFVRGGNVSPEVMNEVNDRGTAVDQQINEETSLTFKAPLSDPDGLDYTVGNVEARKSKAVGFDENGSITSLNLSDTGSIAANTAAGVELVNNILSCTVDDSTVGFNAGGDFEVKTITDGEIVDSTISGSKLVDDTLNGSKLIDDTVDFEKLSGVLDEDDMDSDSASALATQQSIKAYVDDGYSPVAYVGGESVELPNGLIMKFGHNTTPSSDVGGAIYSTNVIFTDGFPNALMSVVATIRTDESVDVSVTHAIRFPSQNQFTIVYEEQDAVVQNFAGFYWQAIGY